MFRSDDGSQLFEGGIVIDLIVCGDFFASRRVTRVPKFGQILPLRDGRKVEVVDMIVIGICNEALTVKVLAEMPTDKVEEENGKSSDESKDDGVKC